MSTFDDLRSLYTTWTELGLQHERDAAQLVWNLAKGFAKQIEAPDTYPELPSDKAKPYIEPWYVKANRYIQPRKAVQDETGEIQFHVPEHPMEVVTRDMGFWISGIMLVLDRAANQYPKTHFQFFLKFSLKDRQCELSIERDAGQKFTFDIDHLDEAKPVYEYMVQMLQKLLSMPPWSTLEKSPIGFALGTQHAG